MGSYGTAKPTTFCAYKQTGIHHCHNTQGVKSKVSTTSHYYTIHLYNQPLDITLPMMMLLPSARASSLFGFNLDFIYMGIAELPIKVESTRKVSVEHFYNLLNFFVLNCTGKLCNVIMVD